MEKMALAKAGAASPESKIKPTEARIYGKNGKNILRLCYPSIKIKSD